MQISVAHACERPANFVQNAQRPKGVPLGLFFGPLCCDASLRQGAPLLSRTALDTGMGVDWLDPTQRALGTRAGKSDLVFCSVVVEDEFPFCIGDVKLCNT